MQSVFREIQSISRMFGHLGRVAFWPLLPLVALVTCVLADLLISGESRVEDRSPVVLEYLGDAPISPDELPVRSGEMAPYVSQSELLDGADVDWGKGNHGAAVKKWTEAAEPCHGWEWPLPALSRVAYAALKQGHQLEAIAAYQKVIDTPISSPVSPPRPGKLPGNSKHVACLTLSDIFLEQRNFERAMEYARLAHDVHKFSSPWDTANLKVDQCLQERMDAIKSAVAGGRRVVLEPRSTVLARFHRQRSVPPPAHPIGRTR